MNRTVTAITTLLLLFLSVEQVRGQEFEQKRKQLVQRQQKARTEINELTRQIDKYEERLVLAEQKYDQLYNQYEDLKKLIALQDDKIEKLQTEQDHIRQEIKITENELEVNREKLQKLVDNYKKTLSYIYKYGRSSQLALILTAGSINQMLVRSHYLQKFKSYREKQANKIKEAQEELERNKKQLEKARQKNDDVLAEIQQEKQRLSEKKERQEKNVVLLRQNKRQIEDRLGQARNQKRNFEQILTNAIQQEEQLRKLERTRSRQLADAQSIADDAERAKEVAKYSTPVNVNSYPDEEAIEKIENSFATRKGELRWPVSSSTISEHFGRKRHPIYGTETENLGILIVTNPREPVRAIHDGFVTTKLPIPGYGDVVIVSHGDYRTVYGNLSEIMIQNNTSVNAGDVIGLSGEENSPKGESVFFMVRKGNQNLDPENWISPKSTAQR